MWARALATFLFVFLCACGGQSSTPSVLPNLPGGGNAQTPPTPTPPPVTISESAVNETPLYVAADTTGAYFGFGSSGTGSPLQHFGNGTVTQTMQAAPSPGYAGGDGVYGIFVMPDNSVYWLSAYFDDRSALPSVQVECGSGAQATLCEPNVQEPTATVIDASHVFWTGGLTSDGGGEIRTSAGQSFDSPTQGVVTLINGPQQSVWGVLRAQQPNATVDTIAEFAPSGQNIVVSRQFPLPSGATAGSITVGGDGNIWFTDFGHSALGMMTLQGTVQEYPSPHTIAGPSYGESQIVTACDGAVWYTEADAGAVVRATPGGHMREYVLPTPGGYAGPISAPPAQGSACTHKLWVGEVNAHKLAEITY